MEKQLIKLGLGLALGEVAYVALVVTIMSHFENLMRDKPPLLAGVYVLLLLVVSATVSGTLILGKPILLYLDGKKREAVQLFGATLGWLVAVLLLIISYLLTR